MAVISGHRPRVDPHCGHVTPDFLQISGDSAFGLHVAVWQKTSKSASLQPTFCRLRAFSPQQTSHLSALTALALAQLLIIPSSHGEGRGLGPGAGGAGGIGGGTMPGGAWMAAAAE